MDKPKDHTILVIEDERPLLEAIKKMLDKKGLSVVTSRTVRQALDFLDELSDVKAIWLDHYLLGKESGIDLVAKLKDEKSKWKNIPIFVVSNTASEDKVQAYLRFGVNKYYTKSDHRLDEIATEIKEFLDSKES